MPPTPWWRYAITGYKSNGNTIYMAKVRSLNILTNIAFMVTIQANQPLYVHCSFMAAQHSINKPSDVIASQVIIAVNIGLYIHIQWYCVTYLKTDIEYKTRLYFHWMYLKSTKFNSSSSETGIWRENLVNTIAADDLAPSVARSSAAMVLSKWYQQVLVFHKVVSQADVPSYCWEVMKMWIHIDVS